MRRNHEAHVHCKNPLALLAMVTGREQQKAAEKLKAVKEKKDAERKNV